MGGPLLSPGNQYFQTQSARSVKESTGWGGGGAKQVAQPPAEIAPRRRLPEAGSKFAVESEYQVRTFPPRASHT